MMKTGSGSPEIAALKSIAGDANTARLGPSRVKDNAGAAEVLRALGQQLMDEADAIEAGGEMDEDMGADALMMGEDDDDEGY